MIHGMFTVSAISLLASVALAQGTDAETPVPGAPAETAVQPASIAPDAQLIVDQYINATGGRSGWAELKTLQGNGSVALPAASIAGTASVMMSRDVYRRTFIMSGGPIKEAMIETGRTGDVVWQLTGESEQYTGKLVEGVERQRQVRLFQFNQLLDLEKHFLRVEVVDVEEIDGQPAMKVLMVPREAPDSREYRYFDQKTNYIVRTVTETPGRPPQESRFSSYRKVGPVRLHAETKIMTANTVLMMIVINNMKANKPLPADAGELPLEIRVLLGLGPDGKGADASESDASPGAATEEAPAEK